MKNVFLLLIYFCIHPVTGQHYNDFPNSTLSYFITDSNKISKQICNDLEVRHREVFSETNGKEYYCSGNIHAEGPIEFLKEHKIISPNNKKIIEREFIRTGHWKVYYDSTIKILRSEGSYYQGIQDGLWKIYSDNGKQTLEIEFKNGLVKRKVEINENGNRKVTISRSDLNIFVINNTVLLILIGTIPILLFRIFWNILTYNKINNTTYIPGLQNYQKGGFSVNLICTFTFWWIINSSESKDIKNYKRIGNYISIFSIICFIGVIIFFSLYGESK